MADIELFELDDLRQDTSANSPGSVKRFNANNIPIPNVGDPVNPKDAANLDTVNNALASAGNVNAAASLASQSIVLGDGSTDVKTDVLFGVTNFGSGTQIWSTVNSPTGITSFALRDGSTATAIAFFYDESANEAGILFGTVGNFNIGNLLNITFGEITANTATVVNNNMTVNDGLIGERILFDETWPAGNNTLNGSIGTWTENNPTQNTNTPGPPPDGGNAQRRNGAFNLDWILTSPNMDLTKYYLYQTSDVPPNDERYTRTRIGVKGWITTHSLDDENQEKMYIEVFDGSVWHIVYADTSNEQGSPAGATWIKFNCDISSYISNTSNTQIRFRLPAPLGAADRWGIGRVFIYESDIPTNMGRMFLGRDGIGIGNEDPQAPLHTTGRVIFEALPTSDPLVAGELWNNSGVLTISAG